jgi:signal transduction histidine kinase
MKARRWLTWLIFCICALAVLEALGWLTWQALRLEDRERRARAEAKFQESIRLALWRMEGEVMPILAQEGLRPYFHYLPFYAPQRAYSEMWDELRPEEIKVPSPLLEGGTAYVKLYFQLEPDGRLTSPQAPTGKMRELAQSGYLDPEFLVLANERLTELRPLIAGGFSFMAPTTRAEVSGDTGAVQQLQQQVAQEPPPEWQQRTQQEYNARKQAAQTANMAQARQGKGVGKEPAPVIAETDGAAAPSAEVPAAPSTTLSYSGNPASEIRQGPFTARWVRNTNTGQQELLLHRTVDLQIGRVVQGFWIDWSVLRGRLREVTADLLPEADFAPAPAVQGTPASHLMASIPVLLAPGATPVEAFEGWSPTRVTLAVTWLAVLAAVGAIGVVLRKSMELSDRRGRFVSAVTHELRTPLTTFCLYTEMLADGMVPEEASRFTYLNTLKAESRRLAGIVENVLEYARLGGKKPPPAGPPIFARDLISRIEPALVRCADRCGMRLTVEGSPDPSLRITADLQTVERILLNLVDNACKYASEARDRRVHLAAASLAKGGRAFLELRVRDHGPGVAPADAARIFRPFRRGRGAAEPKAGLGLGLALSKGLARELGGDLVLNSAYREGAEFVLTLPA